MNELEQTSLVPRVARWGKNAGVGAVIWVLLMIVDPMDMGRLTEGLYRLLLLAVWVIVPLGMGVVGDNGEIPGRTKLYRLLQWLQPVGALAVSASVCFPFGVHAALLASPWLLVSVGVALWGLWRGVGKNDFGGLVKDPARLCRMAGPLYLPVGAIWFCASRAEFELMGFPFLIVTLTALHFHFAGFAAPIITGGVGRHLKRASERSRALYKAAAWMVAVNPILIAIGITVSPVVEVVCSVALALGLWMLSAIMGFSLTRVIEHAGAKFLLAIASVSLVATMGLACTYALGEYIGVTIVHIPKMAQTHGVINVFGFALCGLVALWLLRHDENEKERT